MQLLKAKVKKCFFILVSEEESEEGDYGEWKLNEKR
jgi:hypothetical protein